MQLDWMQNAKCNFCVFFWVISGLQQLNINVRIHTDRDVVIDKKYFCCKDKIFKIQGI